MPAVLFLLRIPLAFSPAPYARLERGQGSVGATWEALRQVRLKTKPECPLESTDRPRRFPSRIRIYGHRSGCRLSFWVPRPAQPMPVRSSIRKGKPACPGLGFDAHSSAVPTIWSYFPIAIPHGALQGHPVPTIWGHGTRRIKLERH